MSDETASFAEFARSAGIKRSYVTALRKADRLVLTDDGKRVRVAESLARIEATRDPARAAVAARHAAARGRPAFPSDDTAPRTQTAGQGDDGADTPPAPPDATQPVDDAPGDEGFQYWRRRSEKARALAAERDNAAAEAKLLDGEQVVAAVKGAITTLRTRLESLPDVLGPQLAAISDEAEARASLAEAIEHALEETSRQFFAIGRQETA